MPERSKVIELLDYKIKPYINKTQSELKDILGIKSKAKNINNMIITKIIELKETALETALFFKKYSIFKTVNLEENDKLKEHMSFPSIDYYDMLKNSWLNSKTYKYFSSKTIVIFVFKKEENDTRLKGVKYLNLNDGELNKIFLLWKKVKNMIIKDEIIIGGAHGYSVENFPKRNENEVTHIRPHDQNSSQGRILLPNGKRIINYCFWLNNSFIESKLKEGLD